MRKLPSSKLLLLLVLVLCPLRSGMAQVQLPLPQPLNLPPTLEETLAVSPAASYLTDATKIQDCPLDKDNPLGLCNNLLYGGMSMFATPLSGNIHIKFYPPVGNISHFEVSLLDGLTGPDVIEHAPILYEFPLTGTKFTDGPVKSSGDLDLTTGGVSNLKVDVLGFQNKLQAYLILYPVITAAELQYPGVYGTALAHFTQRPDGLLDFTFLGATLVPLSNNLNGLLDDKVRIALPYCSNVILCRAIQGPGTSLRPRLYISTKDPDGPECGVNCPNIPFNTVKVFTTSPYNTLTGDRFTHLNIPELGGPTNGWSHLSGRLWIQFGARYGDICPVVIWALVPEGLLASPPPPSLPPGYPPPPSFPGFGINMPGVDGIVTFPNFTYLATQRVLTNDPYDFAVGVINLRTGKLIGDLVYRGLPLQNLFLVIQALNAGRIPTDTFRYQGPASFENGPNGELIFRYSGDIFLDFSTFVWPVPDYNPARGFRAGPGTLLNPFLKFQGVSGAPSTTVVKSGDINETSKIGDPVRIHYTISCDPANKNFAFDYANLSNTSRSGTFHMQALAAVSCATPQGSTTGPGDADIVNFSGFGTWSSDTNQHLATVEISTNPNANFWIVQIDGSSVSSGETNISFETNDE